MAREVIANNFSTALDGALTSIATEMTVDSVSGLPSSGQIRFLLNNEIVVATLNGTTTVTIARAQEDTTATSHADNTIIFHAATKGLYDNLIDWREEGTSVVTGRDVNFVGAGVTVTDASGVATVTIPGTTVAIASDTIWDAKGDIAGGTGADTAARLPVGTNGQVLTADSAEATGMKWTTPDTVILPDVSVSFTADGSAYYVAREAITLDNATEAGTGTLAYAKALAASPTTFNNDPLPVTLATGDILRITVSSLSGYKAVTLERTA